MTSIPASRSARAMIFAPRSWPSSPGLATTTRIFRVCVLFTAAADVMAPAAAAGLSSALALGGAGRPARQLAVRGRLVAEERRPRRAAPRGACRIGARRQAVGAAGAAPAGAAPRRAQRVGDAEARPRRAAPRCPRVVDVARRLDDVR